MTADLRCIADAALAGVHLPLVRYQPRGRYERHGALALVAYDLPRFGLNNAVITGDDQPVDRCFALMEQFFAGCAEPYGVRIATGAHQAFEAALCLRGWRRGEELPVMVLPKIPATPPPLPVDLSVRSVTDEETLRDFLLPKRPPDPPSLWDGIDDLLYPSPACALDPDIALFVGYVDGEPIAQAAVYRLGNVAEIGAVATHPAYRGRGIGAALTWAAVLEGAERGCTSAALAASELGFPVYLRMGFVPVYLSRSYHQPSASG